MKKDISRKSFLRKAGTATVGLWGLPFAANSRNSGTVELLQADEQKKEYAANDHIQIALIGAGMMGQNNVRAALENSGIKIVAACDLYDSRLKRCREFWGDDLFITKNYQEVLDRDDVDSVINATTDHWHKKITIDALNAGKAVYCEKPMVHRIEEGEEMIKAEKDNNGLLQIGSQTMSSVISGKAKELYHDGAIGKLNFVETYWDRQSFAGAWNYSIPPSAGPHNIDWNTFLNDLPEIPFDAEKFFRWRKYQDFGTGVAGDLFVHLFSTLHFLINSNGPERIYGTGGIRFWDDGRDVPDVMLGLFDYPETESHSAFNLSLRVNFADGSGGGYSMRLVGSEGEMLFRGGSLILRRSPMSTIPDITVGNFDESVRREYEEYHRAKYPDTGPHVIEPTELEYRTSPGLSSLALHHKSLFDAMRNEGKIIQDGTFGLRAAAPALAANTSYFEKKPVHWNPVNMNIIE